MTDTRPVVAILGPLTREAQARLGERYRTVTAYKDHVAALKDSGLAGEVRAAVTLGGYGMSAEMLAILPALGIFLRRLGVDPGSLGYTRVVNSLGAQVGTVA